MSNITENRRVPPDLRCYVLGQHWTAVEELQFVDAIYKDLEGNVCGELVSI